MINRQSLVIGSRQSKLALWQSNSVKAALAEHTPGVKIEIREFSTRGDENLAQPLPEIGGKGLFTAELDAAIITSEIDLAVHSLKDLPTAVESGLMIVPVLNREDPRDVLVTKSGCDIESLPTGSIVGTSSHRRKAQILAFRPDLDCRPIRGNVPTRIRKVHDGEFDAVVLAAAGVLRLGLQSEISHWFDSDTILPAPGQAMIAATCRSDDEFVIALLQKIQNQADSCCVATEREVLAQLGGGCSAPIGALAIKSDDQTTSLQARIGLVDGSSTQEVAICGDVPERVATRASKLLRERGAGIYLHEKSCFVGKQIVITRSKDQCFELQSLIRHVGAQELVMPAITFSPISDADLPDLKIFDWLLYTSGNAVRFFAALLERGGVQLPPSTKVACVGSGTAKVAAEHGFEPTFVPHRSSGDALANELVEKLNNDSSPNRQRLLFPSASKVRSNLVKIVEADGNEVLRLPVYETKNAELDDDAIGQLRSGVDAVTFASPSSVNSFCSQLDNHGLLKAVAADTVFACVGRTTAGTLNSWCPDAKTVTAKYPTLAAMIECLEDFFQD